MKLNARHTKIVQTLDVGDGIVVMEDYYKYPEGPSNIYKLDYQANLIWEAELPGSKDAYANKMTIDQGLIKTSSWEGFSCDIDLKTGKILRKNWTK